MEMVVSMSSISDVASSVLTRLIDDEAVTAALSVHEDVLHVDGNPALVVPPESRAWSWRTTVNRSLLPASVSAESRRHLLYAVLQDLIAPGLLLHNDTTSSFPLRELDSRLEPFEGVYRVPPGGGSDRIILFPIHISVPTAFDTYRRKPKDRPQTDKGFRGKFIEFFSSDEAGFFDDHLLRVLRNLFSSTEGMTPLDRALIGGLGSKVLEQREQELRTLWSNERFEAAQSGQSDWWPDVYLPLPDRSSFRPLDDFAEQGKRLHADIDAIAHTYGLSRIERVALVERVLGYHFALYMVRLTGVLYRELDWAHETIWPERSSSPWPRVEPVVRFHERRAQVPRGHHAEYQRLAGELQEAYLLLPVLNNIELAVRAVAATEDPPARMRDGCWAEAKQELASFDSARLRRTREVLTFLAQMGRHHVGLAADPCPAQRLREESVELLFDAVRMHYTAPNQRRYPRDHHQLVFDAAAGAGPTSFLQRQPFKHVVLGDELIYLLVLALFEHRRLDERGDSTCIPRDAEHLRRSRLPLRDFERRLELDLLIPADDGASRDLRASLSRLGMLDRLSDVGDGNFLRHPTGL
jgi:hypothetical protein